MGIEAGQWIKIRSSAGSVDVEVVPFNIKRGNIGMYYPEGNVIVPRIQDPKSLTPVFKRIDVEVVSRKV